MKYIAEKDGVKLTVEQDEIIDSPREWDNLGTMVCFHGRYSLGDNNDYDFNDYDSWEELKNAIIKEEDVAIILPLYLYDHSGITISHSPFSCKWDSGQIGWMFISKEKMREEYSVKRVSIKLKERVETYLIGELETYDQYLRGEVYWFKLESDEIDDSCGGFYGDNFKENGMADHIDKEHQFLIDALEMVA